MGIGVRSRGTEPGVGARPGTSTDDSGRWSSGSALAVALGLLALVGTGDRLIAAPGLFALLYLVPVSLAARQAGVRVAAPIAGLAAVSSYLAGGPHASSLEAVGRLVVFLLAALLLTRTGDGRDVLPPDVAAGRRHRTSEQVLEGILDAVPVRIFWKDLDLRYLGCNALFAHDAGLPAARDVVGSDDFQLAWRDQAELYRADDREVMEEDRAKLLIEELQTTPDGTTITLLTSKVPLHDAEGRVTGILGAYMDISERSRAEARRLESEARYRRLFESAKDGVLLLDADTGRVLDANPSLLELVGTTLDALQGRPIWTLGFLDALLGDEARFAEIRDRPDLRHAELALRATDGRTVDVELVSNVYESSQGRVVQFNIRDVSARKGAQASLARLSTAVEQSAEAIVITDAEGTIVYVNPAFESSTGYSREEALGQNPRILKSGRQDPAFYGRMWAALARGEVWRGRITNRRKDGALVEEVATISPVRDAAGRVVNYVAVKRDVTHETRLEERLFQSQKLEAVGRLAGGVAHDFNNLLGVILGYTEILMRESSAGDRRKLEQVHRAAQRGANLTRQLLAVSRKQAIEPKVLDLNLVLQDVEEMLRRLLGEDVDLGLVPGSDLGQVKADPGQVQQVVMNLCVNARDAMPGGGLLRIETANAEIDEHAAAQHTPMEPGRYVMMAVSDTGSGIDDETMARIFEPFFTTKEPGRGTGLGLAIVYGIVKQAGGFVWVYSEVGQGTTFKVYLPRVDEIAEPAAAPPTSPAGRGSEVILLVEDEASLRELAREILVDQGYEVLSASGPQDALQISRGRPERIDLLVTDVVMPGMNGRDLATTLTAERPGLSVLYMSGYTDDVISHKGVLAAKILLLQKPFTSRALLDRVRKALG